MNDKANCLLIVKLLLIIAFIIISLQCVHSQYNNLSNKVKQGNANTTSQVVFVPTTAFLRVFEGGEEENLYLISEKGKEGYFRLDSTDKTSKDNEGTIIVTQQGKRYKRVFEGAVNITWFGAKGDGITNDTEAFNKAFTAKSNCIYIPYKEAGYKIANVAVTKTVTIKGDNKFNSIILPASNNASCFITEAEFVEYRDLYFDGAGLINTVGIEHKHRISTVSNCFFSGLSKGIFNTKAFVKGGKPDEQTISSCRFRNCLYGVFSDGHFINSKIINSIFHTCTLSAIYCEDESYDASFTTTEGLTIESCLIYDSGDRVQNTAAIELRNVDFSFIRNCMVDINKHTALSLTNSQNCNVSGTYFSSAASVAGSGVRLSGNCSNATFEGCQFYDNKIWGFEISGNEGRNSDNVRINNCSGRLNGKGDFFINGATNTWINNSNFYSNTHESIQASNTMGNTSLYVRATNIVGDIKKESELIIVDLKDCPTKQTTKFSSVNLADGQQAISFPHGLTVLSGQKVFVIASNATNMETVSATASGANIQISRSGKSGDIVINYKAEVQ